LLWPEPDAAAPTPILAAVGQARSSECLEATDS
jgi:hypothetical protein